MYSKLIKLDTKLENFSLDFVLSVGDLYIGTYW